MNNTLRIFFCALLVSSCTANDPVIGLTDKVFELAKIQYSAMDSCLTERQNPCIADKEGRLRTAGQGWWGSGFFPGSLWYVYEYTADTGFRDLAWKHTDRLSVLIDGKTDHDIGFQIHCSYGNALRLTRDSSAILPTYIAAAQKLGRRFSPVTGTIKSWDNLRGRWTYPVIIDNMMNLELLTNAARICGIDSLASIAVSHASTTMKNHFRKDYTTWHLVDYDPATGAVISKETVQGYSDDSAWARGQAWALYGYTMMYRETGIEDFFEQAVKVADMLLDKLPEDGIPYWDFNAPGAPEGLSDAYCPPVRDASAGAIMASAFIELSTFTGKEEYLEMARTQLLTLGSDEYLAKPGENGFFLLKHSVGSYPEGRDIDVAISYADYYFLEALVRYSKTPRHYGCRTGCRKIIDG